MAVVSPSAADLLSSNELQHYGDGLMASQTIVNNYKSIPNQSRSLLGTLGENTKHFTI